MTEAKKKLFGIEKLNIKRSDAFQAVTHFDFQQEINHLSIK